MNKKKTKEKNIDDQFVICCFNSSILDCVYMHAMREGNKHRKNIYNNKEQEREDENVANDF